eukprot:3897423-Pleurochrysis_carterae.AAC.1
MRLALARTHGANDLTVYLSGFAVKAGLQVVVDEEGEQHTLDVAKGHRVLGGNSGYFKGDSREVILALDSVRYSKVWLAVCLSEIEQVLDILEPDAGELKRCNGDDDYQARPPLPPPFCRPVLCSRTLCRFILSARVHLHSNAHTQLCCQRRTSSRSRRSNGRR